MTHLSVFFLLWVGRWVRGPWFPYTPYSLPFTCRNISIIFLFSIHLVLWVPFPFLSCFQSLSPRFPLFLSKPSFMVVCITSLSMDIIWLCRIDSHPSITLNIEEESHSRNGAWGWIGCNYSIHFHMCNEASQ